MARARKRHVQLSFEKLDKNGQHRGGKRAGAGRKRRDGRTRGRPGEPHKRRPTVDRHVAIHVVLRAAQEIGSLRKRHLFRALREATISVAMRGQREHDAVNGAFRIVHISIQRTHIHLLVEADSKLALSRGLQSFQISAAKHINREYSFKMKLGARRRGAVFPDRYHEEIIRTPRQARHTLSYVLNNWRKHREDRATSAESWLVDPFSTGIQFGEWRERQDALVMWPRRETYDPLVVYLPKSWLLREGWKKHGKISYYEVPSSATRRQAAAPQDGPRGER